MGSLSLSVSLRLDKQEGMSRLGSYWFHRTKENLSLKKEGWNSSKCWTCINNRNIKSIAKWCECCSSSSASSRLAHESVCYPVLGDVSVLALPFSSVTSKMPLESPKEQSGDNEEWASLGRWLVAFKILTVCRQRTGGLKVLSTRWAHVGGTPYKETPPEALLEESSTPALLGNAALTMELQTRSFPCFVNVTFPFLPLSPALRKGHTSSPAAAFPAAAQRRAGMATGTHTQCSASPQAPHSGWRCQRRLLWAGQWEGGAVPRWHSSWNC